MVLRASPTRLPLDDDDVGDDDDWHDDDGDDDDDDADDDIADDDVADDDVADDDDGGDDIVVDDGEAKSLRRAVCCERGRVHMRRPHALGADSLHRR